MREANRKIVEVLEVVARHYCLTREELVRVGDRRQRYIARYLCFRMTGCSFSQIAEAFGDIGRNNVVAGIIGIERAMELDEILRREIEGLKLSH